MEWRMEESRRGVENGGMTNGSGEWRNEEWEWRMEEWRMGVENGGKKKLAHARLEHGEHAAVARAADGDRDAELSNAK
jgi:hypothetical protein